MNRRSVLQIALSLAQPALPCPTPVDNSRLLARFGYRAVAQDLAIPMSPR